MITIYGKDDCIMCLKCKQVCQMMGLDFVYKDVNNPEDRAEFMEQFPAILHVPIIKWHNEVFQGYEKFAEAVENNIQNYGEGKI